jgi:hypothetical protein
LNLNRRNLITAGATLVAASAISVTAAKATAATTPSAENQYWADQAALLDPRCYVYQGGTEWGIRVPDDETWYALNIWGAVAGDSPFPIYHRKADVANAFQMPPGFDLSASGSQSFVLYARPAMVQSDSRYSTAPKELYYTRLQTLACTRMQTISCQIAAGTPRPNASGVCGACFPGGFQCGIIRHVSCHNGAWVTMVGPDGASTIINLLDEIDDGRGQRFTGSLMLPFDRSVWDGIWLEFGTLDRDKRSGDEYAAATQTYDGFAHVAFQALPEGW